MIEISEAEAASDFARLLARVRAGAEVVIENGKERVAEIHAPRPATPLNLGVHPAVAAELDPTSLPTSPTM